MDEATQECRLCGSTGPHQTTAVREMMFGTQELFYYYCCAACETLQIVNVPKGEELARHYPPDYYSYAVLAQPRVLQWLNTQRDRFELHTGGWVVGALLVALSSGARAALGGAVRMLGQLGIERDARILDVGCGGGALLDRLSKAGFSNLCGADPFLASDGETPRGVPLMKQNLSEVTGDFDLIMFNHSLEHVPDLVATLTAAGEKLASGGICLVRVPTTSSEAWTIYRQDWVQLDAPRHIVIPSRQGMTVAADRAGLRVDRTFDDSNELQFFGSEAYRRDVALTDPKIRQIFRPKQIRDWRKRAERLNLQGRGDQTGFVLRAKSNGDE
ncbi:class I SAM-dependent methyltransferase [Mycobacterium sp. 852002-53434_SCH5985345]|uniref:class I SAM-dependent methyltransferase n=1 Tax=Mycobacterium sp. 852002-53434_SCH5985345 TaxID=1834107 RepID=UPI0009EDEAAA|nr:class I SAM-dependent methyltransferase [Mycobacterium sp. 852002-53434_SCH5985345]